MLWTFEIATAIWFGFELTSLFSSKIFDSLSILAIGSVLGFVIQSWFGFIFSYFIGLTPKLGVLTIAVFTVASLYLYVMRYNKKTPFTFHLSTIQGWTYLISFFMFFIMMYQSMFKDNITTKGAGYSDLPFHLNIISSLVYGFNNKRKNLMSIDSSFFAGEQLVYPIIPNFYSAFLIATGHTSARYALLVPSTIVGFSLIIGIYTLSLYFTRSHVGSFLSVFIFANLGGLGFTVLGDEKCRASYDLVHNWCKGKEQYWFHSLMHILIPQRAALWALPVCYWTYLCLIIGVRFSSTKMMVLAGILTGLLPQLQMHAYVSVAQWSIAYCLIKLRKKKFWRYFWNWAIFGFVAVALALPQCSCYFHRIGSSKEPFITFKPIWEDRIMDGEKYKPLTLWINGLGFFAIVSLVLCWPILYKEQIMMYLPSIVVFILANFIRYQPWVFDNTKVFYDGWIPFAVPAVAAFFLYLQDEDESMFKMIIKGGLFLPLLAGMTASGLITTYRMMKAKCSLYPSDKLYDFGHWVAENTPSDAIFAVDAGPPNPISFIGGRQLYIGYGGWVYSHGYSLPKFYEFLDRIENGDDIEWFLENNITYAANLYLTNHKFENFSTKWDLVYSDEYSQLYRIKPKYLIK